MFFTRLISFDTLLWSPNTDTFPLTHIDKRKTIPIPQSVKSLRLIGEQRIPHDMVFGKFPVGGISGIDYDSAKQEWILVSDDQSARGPARFYTAKLHYNRQQFKNIQLTGITYFKQPDGTVYPNKEVLQRKNSGVIPDPETIRIDPLTQNIWYACEGSHELGINPFIRQTTWDGTYLSSFELPYFMKFSSDNKTGFRNNLSIEGSSFTPNGEYYFTVMEAPLFQDGHIPTFQKGGYSRITQYNRKGEIISEFAYPSDPVPDDFSHIKKGSNGIAEMLSINDHEFLILERASIQKSDASYSNSIRIYQINTTHSTNIKDMPQLQINTLIPVTKELILDLETLELSKIDNIEGMTFGPVLENGHHSLVLISDNNFNSSQVTQVLAFEVNQD